MLKILIWEEPVCSSSREVCDVPGSVTATACCCLRQPRTNDWAVGKEGDEAAFLRGHQW